MSHCLSFLFYPTISQRWDSWRRGLLLLIRKIRSYNGPFTGLEVRRRGSAGLSASYSASGRQTEILLSDREANVIAWGMGTCVSTDSNPQPAKRKQDGGNDIAPVSAQPIRRVKSKTTEADESACGCKSPLPRKFSMNGATNVACLFTQQGRKGLNQDAMIVCEDFGFQQNTVFCGVFDGHGPYGHLVAQFVRDLLPSKLASNWQAVSCAAGEEQSSFLSAASKNLENSAGTGRLKVLEDSDVDSRLLSVWKESFLNAYMVMDKELLRRSSVDCFYSGTTAVTLVKQGKDVIIGNVGDSRAILATECDDGSLRAVQLTVDLKPNLPEEAERIRQCKGRVFALQDEPEVHRVWLPDNDSPGLAMARAFGDFCLKNFGVISVPEVTYRRLTERDQFIVLATDGVWDVLSNKQVVDIVSSVSARPLAAKAVVERAVRAWKMEYSTSQVDDCAVVCLFVQDILSVYSDRASRKQSKLSSSSFKQYATQAMSQNSTVKELLGLGSLRKKTQVSVSPSMKDCESTFQSLSLSKQPEGTSLSVAMLNFRRSGTVVVRKIEGDCGHLSPRDTQSSDKLPIESHGTADNPVDSQNDNCESDTYAREGLPNATGDDDWKTLEAVPRINSSVTLPGFASEDSRVAG